MLHAILCFPNDTAFVTLRVDCITSATRHFRESEMMKAKIDFETVKFVSINVWFGMDGRGVYKIGDYENQPRKEARFNALIHGLKKLDPDVVAIQEANKLPGYARRIARELDFDAVWKIQNSGIKIAGLGIPLNFSAGNIILAKKHHDLRYLGSYRLSGTGIQSNFFSIHFSEMRNAMVSRVDIGGHPILVFNTQTHFSLILEKKWEAAVKHMCNRGEISIREMKSIKTQMHHRHNRTEQDILKMLGFIRRTIRKYDYPYVVMGDFNTTHKSEALSTMVDELKLSDPFRIKNPRAEGYTWDPRRNTNTKFDGSQFWADGKTPRGHLARLTAEFDAGTPRRIDFIFLSPHFDPQTIQQSNLVFTEPIDHLYVSDHFGIQVVLKELPTPKK
jgi:endonuclease/exonuclease/phosphatase family metal-dependent hydrolase